MSLSVRCDVFVCLFGGLSSSPDDRGSSRAVTTERGSGRAKLVVMTNGSVCKLRRLSYVIKMQKLLVQDTLRDDRGQHGSPDDVTQVSQTVCLKHGPIPIII